MLEDFPCWFQSASVAAKRSLALNGPTCHGSPAALDLRILAIRTNSQDALMSANKDP
jgi:hypothetical protein